MTADGMTWTEAQKLATSIDTFLTERHWDAIRAAVIPSGIKTVGESDHSMQYERIFDVNVRVIVNIADPEDWPKVRRWLETLSSFVRDAP